MNKVDLFYKPLIKEAWGIAKKNYWTVLLFVLVNITVSIGFSTAAKNNIIIGIFSIVVSILFKFWSQRFSIWLAKGQSVKFLDIFNNFNNFKKYFVTTLIYGLIILGGFVLLIIPGIILSLKYFLAPYYSLDKGMKYKEALRASAAATDGLKVKIFYFSLLVFLILIVSMIPFFLGLFITIPLLFAVSGLMYVKLSNNTVSVENEAVVIESVIESVTDPVTENTDATA